MTTIEPVTESRTADPAWRVAWSSVVLGALIAAAVSCILITFGAAVGLGVSSASPTWRDASVALWLLSGIYLVLTALVSFGCGGFVAGRVRAPYDLVSEDTERRDGMHGVTAWALAIVLGVILSAMIASAANRQSSTSPPATTTAPS